RGERSACQVRERVRQRGGDREEETARLAWPVSGYLPHITPTIPHHSATIAIGGVPQGLQRYRAGIKSTSVRLVCVLDVHMEKCGEPIAGAGFAHHEERVADPDLRRRGSLELARRPEHTPQALSPGGPSNAQVDGPSAKL